MYRSEHKSGKVSEEFYPRDKASRKSFNEIKNASFHRKRFSIGTGSYCFNPSGEFVQNIYKERRMTDARDLQTKNQIARGSKQDSIPKESKLMRNSIMNFDKRSKESNGYDMRNASNANKNSSVRKSNLIKSGTHIMDNQETKTDWFVNIISSLDKKLKEIKVSMKKN